MAKEKVIQSNNNTARSCASPRRTLPHRRVEEIIGAQVYHVLDFPASAKQKWNKELEREREGEESRIEWLQGTRK